MDQLQGLVISQDIRQIPAHIRRQGELSVRERAGSRKSCGDAAWPAPYADLGGTLGTYPLFNGTALFHHEDV